MDAFFGERLQNVFKTGFGSSQSQILEAGGCESKGLVDDTGFMGKVVTL